MFSILTVGIVAEAALIKNNEKKINDNNPQNSMFNAEVMFTIQTGEGCGCDPIKDVKVSAYSGEGHIDGITDENGICVLSLVILAEYEIIIEAEDYQNINFEFNVIDDQNFIFHMFEKKDSSSKTSSSIYEILSNILVKKLNN